MKVIWDSSKDGVGNLPIKILWCMMVAFNIMLLSVASMVFYSLSTSDGIYMSPELILIIFVGMMVNIITSVQLALKK